MLETLSPAKIYVYRADVVFLLQVIAVPLKTFLQIVAYTYFDTVSASHIFCFLPPLQPPPVRLLPAQPCHEHDLPPGAAGAQRTGGGLPNHIRGKESEAQVKFDICRSFPPAN